MKPGGVAGEVERRGGGSEMDEEGAPRYWPLVRQNPRSKTLLPPDAISLGSRLLQSLSSY